jgi:hypothetical protein
MNERFKEIYDYVVGWDIDLLPFTKKIKWEGMTMVGVLGDYALYYNSGVIVEIGFGESSIYLNKIGEKYNRKSFHCDIQGNGFEAALTVPGYLREASNCILYTGTSDSFFQKISIPPVAFAFIDGDHNYEQVKRDFFNVSNILQDNGIILLHDTYPPHEDYLAQGQCSDSYKLRQELEKDERFDTFTFPLSVAKGVGLTMCRKKIPNRAYYQ